MAFIEEGKICPKCGHGFGRISWDPSKPKKVTLQCLICGFLTLVDSLDKEQ